MSFKKSICYGVEVKDGDHIEIFDVSGMNESLILTVQESKQIREWLDQAEKFITDLDISSEENVCVTTGK